MYLKVAVHNHEQCTLGHWHVPLYIPGPQGGGSKGFRNPPPLYNLDFCKQDPNTPFGVAGQNQ